MTMAAAIERRTAGAPARSRASRIAHIDVVTNLAEAESAWRALESQFSTPYQRYDLLRHWQSLVAARDKATPLIAIAYDGERRPLLLMPLTLKREHGVRVARFMGGKHTTFNMALCDEDFARGTTAADLAELLEVLRARDVADVLALTQQPRHWHDVLNPFASLPKQPCANHCPVLSMVPGDPPQNRISNSFRRRLKSKERKLQSPGYRYHLAGSETDVDRILDWFFRVKPMRMAEQKLPNVFAEPGVEEFIRSACRAPRAGGGRVIDIHTLECDDEVIAMFAGVADGRRFSMMFNTYTMSARSRYSPGLILMRNIIDHYAGKRYRTLDLGIGSDDYKRLFCKGDEPMFDSFIALSAKGRVAAMAMSALNRVKRQVKRSPMLLRFAQVLRHAF